MPCDALHTSAVYAVIAISDNADAETNVDVVVMDLGINVNDIPVYADFEFESYLEVHATQEDYVSDAVRIALNHLVILSMQSAIKSVIFVPIAHDFPQFTEFNVTLQNCSKYEVLRYQLTITMPKGVCSLLRDPVFRATVTLFIPVLV